MIRRAFLRMLGAAAAGGGVLLSTSSGARAREIPDSADVGSEVNLSLGGYDLSQVEVIDTHVHPMGLESLSPSYIKWVDSFVDLSVPEYDFQGKNQLRSTLRQEFIDQIWGYSRQPGYNNYMARTYGIEPTIEAVDAEQSKHLKSAAALTSHISNIFDREKIAHVVLQSRDPEPVAPKSYIPSDRFVWTWPFTDMLRPTWAKKRDASNLEDVLALIDQRLETAVANGCRGFKNGTAYYRPYMLDKVTKAEADSALKQLLAATPVDTNPRGVPRYTSGALNAALKAYEDYLFKHVYMKIGQLDSLAIIHTAVAMHPSLRPDYNNPLPFYDVLIDEDVQKSGTRFVLIHTGYPSHHIIASMISQFPNVYTDMSFFGQFPGALEETYRAFLSIGPSEKIMHAGDINTVPDGIGFCAWNSRAVLSRVLGDYKRYYGWSQRDIEKAANNILHANARRVFRIT